VLVDLTAPLHYSIPNVLLAHPQPSFTNIESP